MGLYLIAHTDSIYERISVAYECGASGRDGCCIGSDGRIIGAGTTADDIRGLTKEADGEAYSIRPACPHTEPGSIEYITSGLVGRLESIDATDLHTAHGHLFNIDDGGIEGQIAWAGLAYNGSG